MKKTSVRLLSLIMTVLILAVMSTAAFAEAIPGEPVSAGEPAALPATENSVPAFRKNMERQSHGMFRRN